MARNNRKAFTLVEMLVVIVIITMLVALLVPAVIGARARARRVSCMNRMNQAGKAIAQYEAAKGYLPGYVNEIGGGSIGGTGIASASNLSWAVVILEYMGRADLWKDWRTRTGARTSVAMPEYVCPSDTERRNQAGALSFTVNCGISDYRLEATSDDVAVYADPSLLALSGYDPYGSSEWGLFYCHDRSFSGVQPVRIGLDEIVDGAQQTLMLTENLDATSWATGAAAGGRIRQLDVGVVWWAKGIQTQPTPVPAGSETVTDFATFKTAVESDAVSVNSEFDPPPAANPRFKARPSSAHPGGVNAVYADGHADFISDRVDYEIFRDQMISNQSAAWRLIVP